MKERILVVEDSPGQARFLEAPLSVEGYEVQVCANAAEALAKIREGGWDLVLADLNLTDRGDGLTLHREAREALGDDAPEFVILTAYGTVETARRALLAGARDYLIKPINPDEVKHLARNILDLRRLARQNRELSQAHRALEAEEALIGSSRVFKDMVEQAKAAAGSEATILVRGESGTGKELVAELIHAASPRAQGPFVKVNCGAIPENLLEAELFGHEQGAFTDARQARKGRFELANRGTIFLDEVAEMTPALQVKLLRVLQERELERLGGQGEVIPLDFRLVAATNRDLEAMIAEGSFREDLYYRINVITIHAPPLRERREDVELLAKHFYERFNDKNNKSFRGIEAEAVERLKRYAWPGNVRELENVMERAVVLGRGERIRVPDLPPNVRESGPAPGREAEDVVAQALDAGITLDDFGRRMIERALERTQGNVSQAAKRLGMTRRTLQYRMNRDGIARLPG